MRKAYVLAFLGAFASTGTAAAQNLLVNGNFDSNVLGWGFVGTGSFTRDSSLDADSDPSSGSGRLENTAPVGFGASSATQCVAVTGGRNYDFKAWIRFPTGQASSGRAMVNVNFFDAAGCHGSNIGGSASPNVQSTTTGTWVLSQVVAIAAPASAVSAQINLDSVKTEATGSLVANFDAAVFSSALPTRGDFNGDGLAEMAVFRPGTGMWYALSPRGTYTAKHFSGLTSDLLVAADYDGDRMTTPALFRAGNGVWYVLYPAGYSTATTWGMSGDLPVPGDFDGDGKADKAVFRPSAYTWFVMKSTGGTTSMNWGVSGDTPVSGDFDGDGKADCAVVRSSGGVMTWFVLKSAGGYTSYDAVQWGVDGDVPAPADYDGDGKADIAVFRPSTGVWFVKRSSDGVVTTRQWGVSGDIPQPADYDWDGKADIAVYRPGTGSWYVIKSSDGSVLSRSWGIAGDVPVTAPRY
jgi:hypothetical protein